MIINERMKKRKEEVGVSSRQLAKLLYMSPSAVQQWMRGDTVPKIDMVPIICEVMGCTPNYLFGFSDKVNR